MSDGSNGILSWVGPALRTPTGLRLSLAAEAVGEAAPSLLNYRVGASALVNGVSTEVGWGSISSDTHAHTNITLPDLDSDTTPVDIELTIDDVTTDGPWVRRLYWPNDTVYPAPLGDPRGRLAMLTDPVFVTDDEGPIEAWIGPVTLNPKESSSSTPRPRSTNTHHRSGTTRSTPFCAPTSGPQRWWPVNRLRRRELPEPSRLRFLMTSPTHPGISS
ncbi:hypothetical protein [Nocardia beijingensis]